MVNDCNYKKQHNYCGYIGYYGSDLYHNIPDMEVQGDDAFAGYTEITLADIADGEYEGEYDLSLVYAKVKVTINKGRIENIAILKHDNGRGKKAEKIIEDVIGQQKLGVNAITGATASSKAILKAIENALQDAETSD